MNTHSISRIVTGVLILIVGVGALLDSVGLIPFWSYVGTWWPLAVVVAGLLVLLNDRTQYITAAALVLVGGVLQLNNLGVVEVSFWKIIFPVIIIAVGLSILVRRNHLKDEKTRESDEISAIFAGNETVNISQNYKGGKATAIFGGITIDLRDAKIDKEATLDVFALCDGIELKVPREWRVKHKVLPILGGVESKSHGEKANDKSPTLYITGTAALGGIEVKS